MICQGIHVPSAFSSSEWNKLPYDNLNTIVWHFIPIPQMRWDIWCSDAVCSTAMDIGLLPMTGLMYWHCGYYGHKTHMHTHKHAVMEASCVIRQVWVWRKTWWPFFTLGASGISSSPYQLTPGPSVQEKHIKSSHCWTLVALFRTLVRTE